MSNETRKPDLFVTAVVVLVPSKTASFNSPRSILNFRGTTETFENKRVLTNNRNNQEKTQIPACPQDNNYLSNIACSGQVLVCSCNDSVGR